MGHITVAQTSTHMPVFSSHFSPVGQTLPWQRWGMQNWFTHLYPGGQGISPPAH